ncbi:MAG: translation initiation factor IF-6 [Methanobrevibacter sp.]|jgi:translation initiation factor 6|nr:translation initiation factor IF-6 [Methanobrevibacter sp.]MEE3443317.1 translation initiation factor IF-6 [Methanobrevibacter sp.]
MLKRMNLTGSPNLGVYISVNDEVAIVPFNLSTEVEDIIKETLEVDTIKTSIAGCNLNGALAVGNSNGFVVSPYINEKELQTLEDAGLNVSLMPGKYTAVGNIIAANDHGAIVGPKVGEKAVKVIEDTLKVPVEISSIADSNIIGSSSLVTNKGFLVHRDASYEELDFVEEVFKVEGNIGTVCKGMPLVGACGIANSQGAIVGESTTGPEMARLEESLGFLDWDDF